MEDAEILLIERPKESDRKYYVITPYTGRLIPTNPSGLQKNARKLASMLDLDGVDYIIGVPNQGLVPAYAVALEAGIKFIAAQNTRLSGQDTEVSFLKPHRIGEERYIYLYGVPRGSKVAIVEEEITTCLSSLNLISALKEYGVEVKDIGAYFFCGQDENLRELEKLGLNLKYLHRVETCGPHP